jgi:hypothetical protein
MKNNSTKSKRKVGRLSEDSQCALILGALQSAPGRKIAMPELVRISGSFNIHTRVDELRHVHGFTQIRNETDSSVKPHRSVYWLPKNHFRNPAAN